MLVQYVGFFGETPLRVGASSVAVVERIERVSIFFCRRQFSANAAAGALLRQSLLQLLLLLLLLVHGSHDTFDTLAAFLEGNLLLLPVA